MFERIPEPEIMQNKDQCELYNQEFLDCPEIILDFMDTYTEFCGLTEGTVVDLGSGSCNFVIALCKKYPRLKFICYELSEEMIKISKKNIIKENLNDRIEIIQDDFLNATGKFDLVIANRVLHHVSNTVKFWNIIETLSNNVLVCDLSRPNDINFTHTSLTTDAINSFRSAYTIEEVKDQIKNYNYRISTKLLEHGFCKFTISTKLDTLYHS